MKTFELRLIPYDLHAAIKAAAFREGISMNKWILSAVQYCVNLGELKNFVKGENKMYQPKTGEPCHCKKGVQRDNCPDCEGTGMRIDFAKIRESAKAKTEKEHD